MKTRATINYEILLNSKQSKTQQHQIKQYNTASKVINNETFPQMYQETRDPTFYF